MNWQNKINLPTCKIIRNCTANNYTKYQLEMTKECCTKGKLFNYCQIKLTVQNEFIQEWIGINYCRKLAKCYCIIGSVTSDGTGLVSSPKYRWSCNIFLPKIGTMFCIGSLNWENYFCFAVIFFLRMRIVFIESNLILYWCWSIAMFIIYIYTNTFTIIHIVQCEQI